MSELMPYLRLSVRNEEGRHLVRLEGELDLANGAALRDALVEIAGSTVVVDLEELTFLDAAGLGALIQAKQRIEEQGDRLVLCNARGVVARVLRVAELEQEDDP